MSDENAPRPTRPARKVLRWIGTAAAILVAGGATFALVVIGPRNVIGMLRYDQRKDGKLAVGEAAPDVSLTDLDGTTRVNLRERIGKKPVVLVFGSYT